MLLNHRNSIFIYFIKLLGFKAQFKRRSLFKTNYNMDIDFLKYTEGNNSFKAINLQLKLTVGTEDDKNTLHFEFKGISYSISLFY